MNKNDVVRKLAKKMMDVCEEILDNIEEETPETKNVPRILFHVGESGAEKVQQLLNKYFGRKVVEEDGIFGPISSQWFKQFEAETGQYQDGLPTEKNIEILKAYAEKRPKKPEKETVDLWCPFAIKSPMSNKGGGLYKDGYPIGAVIHHTAGAQFNAGLATLKYGARQNFVFFTIDGDGTIYQGHPLNVWGHHAGISKDYEGRTNISKTHVGIEVCSYGRLTKNDKGFVSWTKKEILARDVRYRDDIDNQVGGFYQKWTNAQEESLKRLLLWLKSNNPTVFSIDNIIGHDEARTLAGLRGAKNDPGASLSMTMKDYRSHLKRAFKA